MGFFERFRIGRNKQKALPAPAELEKEQASVSRTGQRRHVFDLVFPGATPSHLARAIHELNEGELHTFLSFAHELEERDLHYASVLGTRKMAVAQLPWTLDTDHMQSEAGELDSLAQEIHDAVEALVKDDAFRPMLRDLLDGLNKGYSVVELMWEQREDGRWWVGEYIWRDQRHFTYDYETGSEILLLDDESVSSTIRFDRTGTPRSFEKGKPLPLYKFAVHCPGLLSGKPIRGALARPCGFYHLLKTYAVMNWSSLVEVFGMPQRIGKYPASFTKDERDDLFYALRDMGSDAAAIVQQGVEIEFVEAGKGTAGASGSIHSLFLEWMDSQVSKRVLGQTMTSDDGSSLAQAKVHDDVRNDIRDFDAHQLSSTVRRHIIEPFVRLNWGDEAPVPVWRFEVEDPEDLVEFSTAIVPLIDRGLKVPAAFVADKFGMPEVEEGDDVLEAPVPEPSAPQEDASADDA